MAALAHEYNDTGVLQSHCLSSQSLTHPKLEMLNQQISKAVCGPHKHVSCCFSCAFQLSHKNLVTLPNPGNIPERECSPARTSWHMAKPTQSPPTKLSPFYHFHCNSGSKKGLIFLPYLTMSRDSLNYHNFGSVAPSR